MENEHHAKRWLQMSGKSKTQDQQLSAVRKCQNAVRDDTYCNCRDTKKRRVKKISRGIQCDLLKKRKKKKPGLFSCWRSKAKKNGRHPPRKVKRSTTAKKSDKTYEHVNGKKESHLRRDAIKQSKQLHRSDLDTISDIPNPKNGKLRNSTEASRSLMQTGDPILKGSKETSKRGVSVDEHKTLTDKGKNSKNMMNSTDVSELKKYRKRGINKRVSINQNDVDLKKTKHTNERKMSQKYTSAEEKDTVKQKKKR